MATAQTSRWVSTAPYVKLTVTQKSSNDGSAVYDYTFQYIASSAASVSSARAYKIKIGSMVKEGTFSINGKSGTHTITSGTTTIKRGTSSKNITVYCSFEFDLTWSGSYAGTKTASDSFALAAKTSYTVTYNSNGGSGGPTTQTKWYGDDLTLATAQPTRSDHTFLGWATSSGGAVAYASGATYSANASITLYAVWQSNYEKPVIANCTIERCDANGNVTDEGTYAKVSFDWSCTNNVTAIGIWWHATTETTMLEKMLSASGTSGRVTNALIGNGSLNVDKAYNVIVLVQDSGGSTNSIHTIGSSVYPIDFLAGGKGVAVGKPAEVEGAFEVGFDAMFYKPIHVEGGFSYNDWYKPSFIRLCRTENATMNKNYKNFNPMTGTPSVDIQKGNLTYGTKTILNYGDRGNVNATGVFVGKDIHAIRVSATICLQNQDSSTTLMQLTILKDRNGTTTHEASDRFRLLETEIRTMEVTTILDVAEGDFICLLGYKGVAATGLDVLATSNGNSKISQLCIEAIG